MEGTGEQLAPEQANNMKTKYYRNRFGGFGIVEADSTMTGDAVDLACCRTEKQAQELVQKLNSHEDLLAACQKALIAIDLDAVLECCEEREQAEIDAVRAIHKAMAKATGNAIPTPAVSDNLNQPL